MKAVANTSPIIFLSKIDAIHLLPECFREIFIPGAVQQELGTLTLPPSIKVQRISDLGKQFVAGALGRLHEGELEAMVLAGEIRADYVLLDDLLARHKARRLGLPVIGTVGVLVLACRQGRITGKIAMEWLDELVNQHGLYLSADMLQKIRRMLIGLN